MIVYQRVTHIYVYIDRLVVNLLEGYMMVNDGWWVNHLYSWLVVYLPLWKILVSWDDDIPNIYIYMEKHKTFQTTNQYNMNNNHLDR